MAQSSIPWKEPYIYNNYSTIQKKVQEGMEIWKKFCKISGKQEIN